MNAIWEVSFGDFLLVTVILGGGAAYMTGKAVASSWGGTRTLVLYVLLLGAAVRFLHFALFDGSLIAPYYYVVDVVVLGGFGWLGRRITRAAQMGRQYRFDYDKTSPLGWSRRG